MATVGGMRILQNTLSVIKASSSKPRIICRSGKEEIDVAVKKKLIFQKRNPRVMKKDFSGYC